MKKSRLNVYGVMPQDLNGPEQAFAQLLDADTSGTVEYWFRNESRKPWSIGIVMPSGDRYFPDFAIKVAGRTGIANCEMMLANMKEGGMISAHDYAVAKAAATALCGGDIETGSLVDEQWLLSVERRLFVELLKNPKTQQRIQHMLETGKPLRN